METISNNPEININKQNNSTEKSNEIVKENLSEFSPKQERFLELVDADRALPIEWGYSKKPKICYFGIMSEHGIMPFNSDGQKIVHEVMAYDEKENIIDSSKKWEEIVSVILLEREIQIGQKDIENRRSIEIRKILVEKQKLDHFKLEQKKELAPFAERKSLAWQDFALKRSEHMKLNVGRSKEDKTFADQTEHLRLKDEYDQFVTEQEKVKDVKFREFVNRRGYKFDDIFEYLDDMDNQYGLLHTPSFVDKFKEENYQKVINSLYKANSNILDVSQECNDGARIYYTETKRDQNNKPIEYKQIKVGRTLEEIINGIIDVIGADYRQEIDSINADMQKYISTQADYDLKKDIWWTGGFARTSGRYRNSRQDFNEAGRVNAHFDRLLSLNRNKSQLIVDEKISCFKQNLNKKIFINEFVSEMYFMPTGIVAFSDREKFVLENAAFDSRTNVFDDIITPEIWKDSWVQYCDNYLKDDIRKLAIGLDFRIDSDATVSPVKQLFDSYGVGYNDRLINEKNGQFSPNIGSYDREILSQFLEKFGSYISSVECGNLERRKMFNIHDWHKELVLNVKKPFAQVPLFVRETFIGDENGLTLNLDKIPLNVSEDIDTFDLATRIAIWDKLNIENKDQYYELLGDRLNANQTVFVKLFGEFVYNSTLRRDLIARLMFLGQFRKWQDGNTEDENEKDFFDQLEQNAKNSK